MAWFTFLVLLFSAASQVLGASTYIEVIIAAKTLETACDTTDVGYVLKESQDPHKVRQDVEELARKSYPDANVKTRRANHHNGQMLGTYVVVVNGETTEGICTKGNFGVGFGNNKNEALNAALNDLGVRAPIWLQGKKSYRVEVARQL